MEVINPTVKAWMRDGEQDPDRFWEQQAQKVFWFRHWDHVYEPDPPAFRWFGGGLTNLSYNCLDYHVERGRSGQAAIVAVNERGENRVLTYAQLLGAVERVARALRGIGVGAGDRVAIYMPTIPEAMTAMLACTRIGAIHLVVFAGFGSGALAERIRLSGAKVLLATDITYRKGHAVPLWGIVRDACQDPASPLETVVVLQRTEDPLALNAGREMTWTEFLENGRGQSSDYVAMESNQPAFVLATSGTTASPKLAVHSHGPYQVGIRHTASVGFGLKPEDVWWSTSDIGWIVGHSFIVYAPLLVGCTTLAFEGALDYPDASTFYRIIDENRISAIFTAPTAVRMLMRYGTGPAEGYRRDSVTRVFCAGEPLNVPAWEWMQKDLFNDRIPVVDHWWQTETGGPVVGNPYGLGLLPIKPGSAGIALPGFSLSVRTLDGERCPHGEKGVVVIDRPFPGLTPTIWGNPDRYARDYWGRIPGAYFTGDAAHRDEDGYYWFGGRADEIIKVAGHRIGTAEVETAFLRHPAVAEAGVTGRPDELRGEVISAFVLLKAGTEASEALKQEILDTVRRELGPVAVIGEINFVSMLPKTRSGKIMRRVFKAVILDRDPGDISTIEDEGSVEELREAWAQMRGELGRQRTD